MRASEIREWGTTRFSPNEFPRGALQCMSAQLFYDCIFPLRKQSGVVMIPSPLLEAHVRHDGDSRHSTCDMTRLSDASDFNLKTYSDMLTCFDVAQTIDKIGGIGIYFNTHLPLIHIDSRPERLVWLRTRAGEYIYREKDRFKFYRFLGEQIKLLIS